MSAAPVTDALTDLTPDADQIREHFLALNRPDEVREVRALDHVPASGYGAESTASGYFTDADALIRELQSMGSASGVYITQNPVDPDLRARADNRLKRKARYTTADSDVVRYTNLTIDCDPVRKAGISATDAELARAIALRDTVVEFVTAELGWPQPAGMMMSGNGAHATWRIDLAADDAGRALVEYALKAVAALFGTADVSIDTTLCNPSRIVKLAGTVAGKGDPLPHRPHRRAHGEFAQDAGIVSEAQLRALVALAPEPATVPDTRTQGGRVLVAGAGAPYDVPALLRAAGIGFSEHTRGDVRVYRLERCLSSDAHNDGAAILQFASGAVAFRCLHNSCASVRWQDVRMRLGLPESPSGAATAGEKVSAAPREGIAAERKLLFRSAREIAEAATEDAAWILDGYIAEGAITEIDGKIKSAGKTTLATYFCRAALDGHAFVGRAAGQTPIVYLTEQSPATFVQALKRADLLDREDFRALFWHDTIGVPWPEIVAAARAEAKRIGAKLLIVDTVGQFSGVRGDAENNAGTAHEAMAPLQEAAAADSLAVVVLRHDRKSGGDVGDSGRGSSAFSGAVDVVLQLSRPEGQSRPGVRVLKSLSRFDETPETLVIELTEAGYVALGDAEAVATQEARTAVLKAAPDNEGAALKEAELIAAAGVKRTVGQEVLREHLAAGLMVRIGGGKRGDPYRYWRPATGAEGQAKILSAAAPVVPAESNSHHPHEDEKLSAALTVEVPAVSFSDSGLPFVAAPAPSPTDDQSRDPFLSAATPTLRTAERNERDDDADPFAAVVAECRGCGGSVDSGQAYCFACDPRSA
jgi:hypothetical protein